jgi:hypothetical protein
LPSHSNTKSLTLLLATVAMEFLRGLWVSG